MTCIHKVSLSLFICNPPFLKPYLDILKKNNNLDAYILNYHDKGSMKSQMHNISNFLRISPCVVCLFLTHRWPFIVNVNVPECTFSWKDKAYCIILNKFRHG